MVTASVRPWQGTFLAVLNIIATVFLFLGGLAFLAFQGMVTGLMTAPSVEVEGSAGALALLTGMGAVAGVILLAIGVLYIFMTIGIFKGQKWAVIVSLVFSVLAVVSSLINFNVGILLVNAFVLYLAVMCYRHPFYGAK
ncbi:hypothetical protein M0P48_03235 [Candidatus Gracilibacteria bacterium]|jgi:hypothetical protein|nr:hypothetical protein [Candidatus Gracilibacteria bacterium]